MTDQVVAEIRASGARALAIQANVADEAQVTGMFAAAVGEFGTLDILVSNAGMEKNAPFHEMTTAQWDAVINVNLRGAFLCAREAVREFLPRGVRPEVSVAAGKIIFISSVHDVIPWAGHVNYASSKGGLMLLMKSLAQEVAPLRIRVNSISPGAIRTPINQAAWSTPEAHDALMRLVPYPGMDRAAYGGELDASVRSHSPGLVLLAGFMRILDPAFTAEFAGRLLNIHPSLLPLYPGLHTHRRALEAGDRVHGCTVHFVTAELDAGPRIVQARVPILAGDSEEVLSARVQRWEHMIYPEATRWFAEGRLAMRDSCAWLDGHRLEEPVMRGET